MRLRYPELDWLRTLSIVGMVVYHAAYDLDVLYGWNVNAHDNWWKILQLTTAILFLLLVGASFAASSVGRTPTEIWRKALRRFGIIGVAALAVSAATWLMDGETYVRFGILHLIALSSLLLPLLSFLRERAAILGVLIITLSFFLNIRTNTAWLLPLGLMPPGFRSVDWFPLVPWFGYVLIGYAMGHALYVRGLRGTPAAMSRMQHVLAWPGQHALAVYLLHQPLLLGSLWLLLGKAAF